MKTAAAGKSLDNAGNPVGRAVDPEMIISFPLHQLKIEFTGQGRYFFLAEPCILDSRKPIFIKYPVTRRAAERDGYPFRYLTRPNRGTCVDALGFAGALERDQRELETKDTPDLQGFIWVQGSDEYPG